MEDVMKETDKRLTVAVVIPARNEEQRIGDCLSAILHGKRTPDELIVADGVSRDDTIRVAKRYGAKIVMNPKGHAAGGRNAGIRMSKSDIIAFTDADCIPDFNWLSEICEAFEAEDIDGLGTYIEPAEPQNLYEKFWGTLSLQILMSYEDTPYYVASKTLNEAFITASCAYKRELLERLGGFSDYFGNNAEDIDLCWRALEAGAKLKYVPSAKIVAHSPTTVSGIIKKSFRNGISSSKLQKRYSGKLLSVDGRLYVELFKNIVRLFGNDPVARLFVVELFFHLTGKYYGSIRYGVINL